MLVPFKDNIYNYSYIYRDGLKFYILDKVQEQMTYYVFDKVFPEAQIPTLQMLQTPRLAYEPAPQRVLSSHRYPNIKVSIQEKKI